MSRVEPPAGSEDVCCPGERQLPPCPTPGDPSLPPPAPSSATQTPPFYHPLLVHLRPSTPALTPRPPRPSSTTPFYRDVPRDGQPRLHVESALYTYTRTYSHVYTRIACIASRCWSNRYRRSLRPSLPSTPSRFPSYERAYLESALFASSEYSLGIERALSLSLSLLSQRCRKPSPRHRCRGSDGQWVQRTVVYFSWTETSLTLRQPSSVALSFQSSRKCVF